jgi:hypothetical protein
MYAKPINTVGMAFLLPATRGRGTLLQGGVLLRRLELLVPDSFMYENERLQSWEPLVDGLVTGGQTEHSAHKIGSLIAIGSIAVDYEQNLRLGTVRPVPATVERNLRAMLAEFAQRDREY